MVGFAIIILNFTHNYFIRVLFNHNYFLHKFFAIKYSIILTLLVVNLTKFIYS
jgi:hypothetical protein